MFDILAFWKDRLRDWCPSLLTWSTDGTQNTLDVWGPLITTKENGSLTAALPENLQYHREPPGGSGDYEALKKYQQNFVKRKLNA